jgi:hypothetical protein
LTENGTGGVEVKSRGQAHENTLISGVLFVIILLANWGFKGYLFFAKSDDRQSACIWFRQNCMNKLQPARVS